MNGHHHLTNGDTDPPSHIKQLKNTQLANSILIELNERRQSRQFTDVILSVDQEDLHCHRCILAASSPYFQATFSNEFQEAITARVVLHDISPWIMKRILDYVYSGDLEITLDNAQDYLRTGHMLQYPAIVQACCELLADHLHVSNCLGVKEFAAMYHCDSLEQTAYDFATGNFASVVEKGEELSELSYESLVEYLSSDSIDISNEMILWKAIHNWVYFDSEERKCNLASLLTCMRLGTLTCKELSIILDDPIVRSQPKSVQLIEKVRKSRELIMPPADNSSLITEGVPTIHANPKLQGYQKGARPSTLPRDMIVVFGGSSDYELTRMEAYDPQKDRWVTFPSPPENIVKASITSCEDTIFISGGIVNNTLSKTLWMFCCKEKIWTKGACLKEARARHSSVIVDNILYISGGVRMDQSVIPMTEIHAYDIKTNIWKHVGDNNTPKLQSTLLGFNSTLYELGGKTDGAYTSTMETYKITNNGSIKGTGEHYVLPCNGDPGPLKAVLDEKELIIILWEHTGQLFTLNTNGRRFYPIEHTMPRVAGSLVSFNHKAYILGGHENGSTCRDGQVLDLSSHSSKPLPLPAELIVHRCVHVKM